MRDAGIWSLALAFALAVLPAKALPPAKCLFAYTAPVRDRIVAPVLKAYLGAKFVDYDVRRPYIVPFEDTTGLDFDSKSGRHADRVVVMFDNCKRTAHIGVAL